VTASTEIRVGSLFSGTGALDTAALAVLGERARIVWHADIKPAAAALLAARDPGVPNLGDIHGIDAHSPAVDALTFGWPCQPHSSAGKRLGEADPRALWPEVARIIAALRPRHLFGENVARVASNGELARVVTALAQLGYLGTYRTLRASDVGAPHRRDRLFLYAVDADADAAPRLPETRVPLGRGGPAATRLGTAEPRGRDSDAAAAELTLLPTPSAQRAGYNVGGAAGRVGKVRYTLDSIDKLLPTPAVADSRNTRNATAGRSAGQEHHHAEWTLGDVAHAQRFGEYGPAIARWERVTGRAAPPPTQIGTRTGRPQLSPRFVEWMMGLPAGWVELPELSRSQQLSLLGDGVVPQQATAAYAELVDRMHGRAVAA
jgi:DNA (cytosine-5)-methyltransferase 1